MKKDIFVGHSLVIGLIVISLGLVSCNQSSDTTSTGISTVDTSTNPTGGQNTAGGTASGSSATASVVTYHNDLFRDGQNLNETILNRSNVNSSTFGKIGALPVDGLVYAQPLYVSKVPISGTAHNVVFVATEHDSVYAFDTDTLSTTPIWHRNFVHDCLTSPAVPSNCSTATPVDTGAPNVSPEVGITATPVIDPIANVMYLTAFTKESGIYYWRLHALSLQNGMDLPGSPLTIDGFFPGMGSGANANGLVYFDPPRQLSRAGLVLNNGLLYIAFTSFNDQEPTHGWLMAYNAQTLDPVSSWMTTPDSGDGSIWMAGGAPAVDTNGSLFFATGNGDANYFTTTTGALNNFVDYSDSILKLTFGLDGFILSDFFTPYNYQALSIGDVDVGSGGVLLLPDQTSGNHTHLLVGGGKQGTVYLIDRDAMGELNTSPTASNNNNIVQELVGDIPGGRNFGAGIYGTPSYFGGSVFIAGNVDYLRKIPLVNGLLNWAGMTQTNKKILQRGATTSISANGTQDGIIWYMDGSAYTYTWTPGAVPPTLTSGPPILYAFSTDDLSTPLYASNQVSTDAAGCPASAQGTPGSGAGCAVKFALPTVVGGKVFVGTNTEISVYGLRNSVSASNFHPDVHRGLASVKTPEPIFSMAKPHVENSCPLHAVAKTDNGSLF